MQVLIVCFSLLSLLVLSLLGDTADAMPGTNWVWYLEARPSLKYTTVGGSPTMTCYNTSSTTTLPHDSRWYKIAPNGTLQQLPTGSNERVRSDGSQLRISSARIEDNGTFCCKGPMQPLDTCDNTAIARLIVVIPPEINPGQNQTVQLRSNAIVECIVKNLGNPPFTVYRWQKSRQRLVTDGTKYISQLNESRMILIILNSTADDEGYYQCILETPVFQRRQASVFLSVNYTTGLTDTPLANATYEVQLYAQDKIAIGMALTIQCVVMGLGNPVETNAHLCLVLPTGEVIIDREFNAVATMEYTGIYSCVAFIKGTPTVSSQSVTVYAAPQPSFHTDTISASYGSSVTLPCTISVANPSPSFTWKCINDSLSSQINETLNNGSLLVVNVQKSGTYQCIAQNDYGNSTQIIQLNVKVFTVTKQQSLKLVGIHLQSPCDQVEHKIKLSSLLEEYVTRVCNCGEIVVIITVVICTDNMAVYNVQLTGIMVTEAALSLITNIQSLTEGLDLGVVVLYLQVPEYTSGLHCNEQKKTCPSSLVGIITVLMVLITTLSIFILIYAVYQRRRMTMKSHKHSIEVVNSFCYVKN